MNPSYMAFQKAIMSAFMGVPHEPKPKDTKETSINGRAFAPGHGVQQETGPEKEAKVQAHLIQLAAECKQRYLDAVEKYPEIFEVTQAESTANWVKREMKRNRENSSAAHALYVETQIAFGHKKASKWAKSVKVTAHRDGVEIPCDLHTGRKYLSDEPDPITCISPATPPYPYSDMVREAEEAQAEAEAHVPLSDRIAAACIYSGEQANLNYDNYTNEELTKWHQQG